MQETQKETVLPYQHFFPAFFISTERFFFLNCSVKVNTHSKHTHTYTESGKAVSVRAISDKDGDPSSSIHHITWPWP